MTKTATKTKKTTNPVETTVDAPTVNAVIDDFNTNGHKPVRVEWPPDMLYPVGQLSPSPTNPRKRFPEASIAELAGSIKEQGVIEPLIIRPAFIPTGHSAEKEYGDYEIVCGERRWRSSQVAGESHVPAHVRELSDEQVLEIQIHENLHREDVHPMDEALGYESLQKSLKALTGTEPTIAELAVRVGKSERYVLNRLKLNALIEEAQADIDAGHLPLVYALEIAKYPADVQKPILDEGTYYRDSHWDGRKQAHIYTPIKGKVKPWSEFTSFIQKNVLHLLSAAPFDLKATNLRKDGLACVACPDRSGANASLFDADQIDKKDACLNPLCFRAKAAQLVTITRERIAHEANVDVEKVPTINLDAYSNDNGYLGKHSFTVIGKKKPYKDYYGNVSAKTCDKSTTAVNVGDGQYGKTYLVCLADSGCKTHYGSRSSSSNGSSAPKSEKDREVELDLKRQRREELFDCRVSDIVRKRVFRLAAEKFAGEFLMSQEGPDTFLAELLTKLWLTSNNDIDANTRGQIVQTMLRDILDDPKLLSDTWRSYKQSDTATDAYSSIVALSDKHQKLMLFLLVHGNKGNTYSDAWRSQIEVKALAEYYGIDYRLIDAQVRVQVAEEKAKKHLEEFKRYLNIVEAGGEKALIPRPFSSNWKPKD